ASSMMESEVWVVRQAVEKPRQEEATRHSLACFAARSAALDLAGVPAKLEHRGQHKKMRRENAGVERGAWFGDGRSEGLRAARGSLEQHAVHRALQGFGGEQAVAGGEVLV